MEYPLILSNLFYLFIQADGSVKPSEVAIGEQMALSEGIDLAVFASQMQVARERPSSLLYNECIDALRKQSHKDQIKCVAWLCAAANADGFMDRNEWQFIYKIYHKELRLPLDEIMMAQKELLNKSPKKHKASVPVL